MWELGDHHAWGFSSEGQVCLCRCNVLGGTHTMEAEEGVDGLARRCEEHCNTQHECEGY